MSPITGPDRFSLPSCIGPHLPVSVTADQACGVQLQVAGGGRQRSDQQRPELLHCKRLPRIPPQGARQLLTGLQEGPLLLLPRHPERGVSPSPAARRDPALAARGPSGAAPAWYLASPLDPVRTTCPGHSGHGHSWAPGPPPGLTGNRKYWERGRDCEPVSEEEEGSKAKERGGVRELWGVAKKGGLVPANEKGKWSLPPPLEPLSF